MFQSIDTHHATQSLCFSRGKRDKSKVSWSGGKLVGLCILWSFPCLVLTACVGFSGPPDVDPAQPGSVSLSPQSWYILYGEGMPNQPSPSDAGAWSMTLPNAPGSIHYVQTPYTASSLPTEVSITFRMESSSDAVYNGEVDPGAGNPASFHLFLERRGDDFTNEYYRWWAGDGGYVLGSKDNSVVTIEIPLTADCWTSVYGHHNSAEFADALNNLGWVGITFGGKNYWGHGVNMLAGNAKFTMIDFQIKNEHETPPPSPTASFSSPSPQWPWTVVK